LVDSRAAVGTPAVRRRHLNSQPNESADVVTSILEVVTSPFTSSCSRVAQLFRDLRCLTISVTV
jgi:hypothetical protein